MLCSECRARLARPTSHEPVAHVDSVLVPWAYEGAPRNLVLALKLRSQRAAAGALAAGVCDEVKRHGLTGSVITWVPARRPDIRLRGFDHAELLARHASARLGLPALALLKRAMASVDQTSLTAPERRRNLAGVFAASRSSIPSRIVLVDDLITTGATASACAGALRAAGATHVEVLAPCRA